MPHSWFGSISRFPAFPLVLLISLLVVPSVTSANETDQDVPVSAVGGAVHADLFTGTATTSIPIAVPRGAAVSNPTLPSSTTAPTATAGSALAGNSKKASLSAKPDSA